MDKEPVPEVGGEDWAVLRQFLPDGWEEEARRSGALRRARGVGGAEVLLRLLLMHVAAGCSLVETVARAHAAGLANVSAVALFKRLQASEEWLRWLAERQRNLMAEPLPATARRLRAVDATTVSEPGSTGTDWRVHYAINLTTLQCDFFAITDVHGGETMRRVPIEKGDVILGDRAYSNPAGAAHVVAAGGDVLFRLNWHTLPQYHEDGRKVNVAAALRSLRVGEIRDIATWILPQTGDAIPGRLIAVRRSAAATRHVLRQMEMRATKKQKKVSAVRRNAAQYFTVWTTLTEETAASDVLAFYRSRWQIELSFKRMKSLLGLGHLPKKDPSSARAWLHGKLLTSLLVERVIQAANTISPWGY